MPDLRELYQEVILDHSREPRNRRALGENCRRAEGFNPLCGDRVTVYVELDPQGERIRDVCFLGSGCAISTASASMMTQSLRGKSLREAEELLDSFRALVTGAPTGAEVEARLGGLVAFGGVREFPVRVKCATLPWHTMHAALAEQRDPVTTE
jgi:nitrogen fixation NifU-like protein